LAQKAGRFIARQEEAFTDSRVTAEYKFLFLQISFLQTTHSFDSLQPESALFSQCRLYTGPFFFFFFFFFFLHFQFLSLIPQARYTMVRDGTQWNFGKLVLSTTRKPFCIPTSYTHLVDNICSILEI
jgi:hypothetical protein